MQLDLFDKGRQGFGLAVPPIVCGIEGRICCARFFENAGAVSRSGSVAASVRSCE